VKLQRYDCPNQMCRWIYCGQWICLLFPLAVSQELRLKIKQSRVLQWSAAASSWAPGGRVAQQRRPTTGGGTLEWRLLGLFVGLQLSALPTRLGRPCQTPMVGRLQHLGATPPTTTLPISPLILAKGCASVDHHAPSARHRMGGPVDRRRVDLG
jgi:hypothetical protein